MTSIVPFTFESSEVRIVDQDGEIWFVAKDIAETLGYTNPQKAVRDHCKKRKILGVNETFTLDAQTTIIPESDVYRLIMRSKLPSAEKFEEWVTTEVLPTIRKTGHYGAPQINLRDPDQLLVLLTDYAVEQKRLKSEIGELKPQAEALERIALSDGSLCITDAAKSLQVNPKDLFGIMSARQWIYKRFGMTHWVAYQDKIQQGLLEHKVTVVSRGDGTEKTATQVRITPKGMTKLSGLLNERLKLVS